MDIPVLICFILFLLYLFYIRKNKREQMIKNSISGMVRGFSAGILLGNLSMAFTQAILWGIVNSMLGEVGV